MKKALIHNNKIIQIESIEFEVHSDFKWISCPDDCNTSWSYDGININPPAQPTLEQLKESRKAESAQKRYEKETSGVTVNGRLLLSTREDVRILESAMDKIRRGLVSEVTWKAGDAKFLKLRSNNIDNIESAILTHIQAAFDREAEYDAAIDACATVEELAAIELIY